MLSILTLGMRGEMLVLLAQAQRMRPWRAACKYIGFVFGTIHSSHNARGGRFYPEMSRLVSISFDVTFRPDKDRQAPRLNVKSLVRIQLTSYLPLLLYPSESVARTEAP